MTLTREVTAGAVGGLAGGLLMTGVMAAGMKTGMIRDPLPLKFDRRLEELAGIEPQPGSRRAETGGALPLRLR